MKKIVFFNIPAYGHTNPTLRVVKQLTDLGHKVYYFSFSLFKNDIEACGGIFISCDEFTQKIDMPDNAGDRLAKDISYATQIIVENILAMDDFITHKLGELLPDVVVYDSVAYWGRLAAEKLGIPCVCSTTTFAFNRYSAKSMQGGITDLVKLFFQLVKSQKYIKKLNRHGYKINNIFDIIAADDIPTVVYTSKEFQPFSETFGINYCFAGPLIRPGGESNLKSNRPLIYISMGTVNNRMTDFFNNCITAFNNSDYDVIISTGNRIKEEELLPHSENIKLYRYVNQISILKSADVFITHCGMNSTSEGLYFGLPLLMFPQTKEQFSVAKRARELGCGIITDTATPESILDNCLCLLKYAGYRNNALKISASFKACGGAKAAAEHILKYVDRI